MNDTDIFHDIVMSEQRSQSTGYQAGLNVGRMAGMEEGIKLGWEKGASLGSEMGFYSGFAEKLYDKFKDDQSKQRVCKVLLAIKNTVENLPWTDPTDQALFDQVEKVRAKFKQTVHLEMTDERPSITVLDIDRYLGQKC